MAKYSFLLGITSCSVEQAAERKEEIDEHRDEMMNELGQKRKRMCLGGSNSTSYTRTRYITYP